jgi:hypothetical protein
VSFIDRVFVGKVLRDFGVLSETGMGLAKLRVSLLLAERRGRRRLIFKQLALGFLSASVSYMEVPVDAIPTLQRWIGEAQALADSAVPVESGGAGGPYRAA